MRNLEHFKRRSGKTCRTGLTLLAALLISLANLLPAAAQQVTELYDYTETTLNGTLLAEIGGTLEQCSAVCSKSMPCKGFSFSSKGNSCRLMSAVTEIRADPNSRAGTRDLMQNYKDPENPPLATRLDKLRQTDSTGEKLLELSLEAYRRNDRVVGRQAIELAIERGNQDAKLEMARWYDPRTFDGSRADAADANRAARSYWELNKEHNNSQASELLRRLCSESRTNGSSSGFQGFFGDFYCEGL